MRLLAILVLAVFMDFAVPMFRERAVVKKVESKEANQAVLGPEPDIDEPIDSTDPSKTLTNINPPDVIDTKKYETVDLQHQTDQAVRRSERAQEMPEHGYDPRRN